MNTLIAAKHTWVEWTQRSTNRRILGAAVTIAFFTAVVKIASASKELLIAWRFGIGDDLDVLFTSLLAPMFVAGIVSESLNAAFIPAYIKVRDQQGQSAANRLFVNAAIGSIVALVGLAAILVACVPFYFQWLAIGFSAEKLQRAISLFYIATPWIVIRGMIMLWSGVLNAGKRFAIASISPAITPLVIVVALLISSDQIELATVVIAMIAGASIELCVIGFTLRRQQAFPALRWNGFDQNMRPVIRQWIPLVAGAMVMTGNGVIDQAFASSLPSGSVAACSYGIRLVTFVTSLIAGALGTAIFPYLSTMVVNKSWNGVYHTMRRYLALILLSTIPISCVFLLFSEAIVSFFLQHGDFTYSDTQMVARVNSVFALQIPFYVASFILVRYISAVGRNIVLMISAFVNMAINVALNCLFMPIWGTAGIALSTVLVYAFSAAVLTAYTFWHLRKQLEATTVSASDSSQPKA